MQTPTVEQLRNDIDTGGAGDKIGFPDPATAPLGTDAEAGGFSPTTQELRIEAVARTRFRRPLSLFNTRVGALLLIVSVLLVVYGVILGAIWLASQA